MAKTITVQKLAKASGCSASTVSRVLNGRRLVAPATRKNVEQAVRELGYRHPAFDRRVAAVIHPLYDDQSQFLEGTYVMALLGALTRELYTRDYRVMVVGERDLDLLAPERFCGVVSMAFSDAISAHWSNEQPLPLILINMPGRPFRQVYSVFSDEIQGVDLAVEHLHRNGHRNIGLLQITTVDWSIKSRGDAFCEAMTRRRLDASRVRVAHGVDAIYDPLGTLIYGGATALIVAGEGCGHRVLAALSKFKLRVPEDLSLVAWESKNISEFTLPPLTTVGQDFAAIGRHAVDCLDAFLARREAPMQIHVPYLLNARTSVKTL